MKEINLKEIQYKLYESLKDSKWNNILKLFILSDDFLNILTYLWKESSNNRKFTPVIKQLFRAFNECPYNKLKVIIVGQDPYPQINTADGIAFSRDKDLKRWSNQGILLLNTALTTEIREIGKHFELWKPFINFLFDSLRSKNKDLIYVFMGKKAENLIDMIDEKNNDIIITSHPASGAYKGKNGWNCNDVFNKINNKLKAPILW